MGYWGPGWRFLENIPVNLMHLKEIPKHNAQSVGSVCKNIYTHIKIGLGSGGMIPWPPSESPGGVPEGWAVTGPRRASRMTQRRHTACSPPRSTGKSREACWRNDLSFSGLVCLCLCGTCPRIRMGAEMHSDLLLNENCLLNILPFAQDAWLCGPGQLGHLRRVVRGGKAAGVSPRDVGFPRRDVRLPVRV